VASTKKATNAKPPMPVIMSRGYPSAPHGGSRQQAEVDVSYVVTRKLVTDDSEQIDSALQSAMNNQRERIPLFQIEDSILTFMKSK
jgi:hypothetical protein